MEYDIVIRYLAKLYLREPPRLSGGKAIAAAAKALRVNDLSTTPISQVSLSTGQMKQGLALNTDDHSWQVISGSEAIEVVHRSSFAETNKAIAVELTTFVERAKDVLLYAISLEPEKKSHRIAIVTEGLLREMPTAQKNEIAYRLLNLPNTFRSDPWEWDWRCVSTVDREFGGRKEPTNTIATSKRISGEFPNGAKFDRIRVDLDINTPATNTEERFRANEMASFMDSCLEWYNKLSAEVVDFMGISHG